MAAKTTVFIGQAGVDGGDKFSVAENWSNGLPVAGDDVVVSSVVATVWNDYEADFKFENLYMKKNASVDFSSVLRGNSLKLTRYYLYDGCKSYVEVASSGNDLYLGGNGSSEFHGKITCGTGYCRLYIDNNTSIYTYAPLVVNGTLTSNGFSSYKNGNLYLCSAGNYFRTSSIWYNNVYFGVDNAVDPEFVIGWGDANTANGRGMYRLEATDQTANRIVGTLTRTTGCQISGSGTLTLNGTEDAVSPCLLQDSISVVWNPSGPYTQTFTNRAHTTTGSLTVSNGTVRLASGGSFKSVKTITVAPGATFDLATPTASTLSALTTLNVDGTFKFADGAANPFGAASLAVKIGIGGKLHVPSDVTISLPRVCVGGVWQAADSYSGESWIEGGGTVAAGDPGCLSWTAPVDGSWSDGAKWTGGSVPLTTPAYVTAMGADYDVAFDAAAFSPSEIHVGNDATHTARLLVSGDKSMSSDGSTTFEVSDGGAFEVASGLIALTNNSGTMATVSGTGVWRVTGGTNTMYVGGTGLALKDGGTLQVTAGLFTTQHKTSYENSFLMQNGNIEVSGTGAFRAVNSQGAMNPMGSGNITASGSGSLYYGRSFGGPRTAGVPLRITLRDNASFDGNAGAYFGDTLTGGETYISLYDNSTWNLGWTGAVGINRACLVQMDVHDAASVSVGGYGWVIGSILGKKAADSCFPTGIVNVVGGTFNGNGEYYGNSGFNGTDDFQGLLIGGRYASNQYLTAAYRLHGELNVSGSGAYSQAEGYLAVGMDKGDGFVRVDGGTLTKSGGGETLVGVCCGNGLFEVTGGGTATLGSALYAGGVNPAVLEIPRTWSAIDTASTTATGLVRVVDGTLAVNGAMTFGARGMGVLEVGSNGVVTASSLTLSNNVASALSFKFGENGVGSVALSGALTVASGVKLKIDASAYRGTSNRIRLLSAASVSGAFDPADVEVVSEDGRMTCALKPDGLYAVRQVGFMLIVR